ncbi:MAG: hypothetical protein AB1349_07965 [Elusimicrobiota bacterium]
MAERGAIPQKYERITFVRNWRDCDEIEEQKPIAPRLKNPSR